MIQKTILKYSPALFFSFLLPQPVIAQEAELLREISVLSAQLVEVDELIGQYNSGLIVDLAKARREALLLAKILAENRIKAERGEASVEVTVFAVEPDETKAIQLLGEMVSAQSRIEIAEGEVKLAGGLLQALAISRLETERLTLAQLQMGYLQAKYGIAFPVLKAVSPSEIPATQQDSSDETDQLGTGDELVAWADSRFPNVDYTLAPFEQANRDKLQISGWWTIETERAAIDDSPMVTTINYSAYSPQSYGGITALLARCSEGETALIFLQDDFLISDYRRQSFEVTVRIDDEPARKSRWRSLTSNKGAGLFGDEAENYLRSLYEADKLFIRLTEKNGQNHNASFLMDGTADAIEAVAGACGWSTLTLSADDYKAVQTLLNVGGFDAGIPDGQWGAGSRTAMKRFQATIDLPQTGAADRATLKKLGFGE